MEVSGKVVKIEGNTAYVEIIRKSSCDSCESCANKGVCHSGLISSDIKSLVIKAKNSMPVNIGDRVKLKTNAEGKFNLFCALLFVLPLVLLFTLYFLCGVFDISEMARYVIAFGVSLVSFLGLAKALDKFCNKNINYEVSEISEIQ